MTAGNRWAGHRPSSVERSVAAHSLGAEEAHQQEKGQNIRSAVHGGLRGIINTFAVVAGVAGAPFGSRVLLILGFANLIADGLSRPPETTSVSTLSHACCGAVSVELPGQP